MTQGSPDGGPAPLYLSGRDVEAAMPGLEERLRLAELTMTALVADAELPPKIAVHPRPQGSFAHAMPALLRPRSGASGDLLGIKWVSGFPANAAAGLPAIQATILLDDPRTGRLQAVLDGGPITAQRTAAVSGVAVARWAPTVAGRPLRAALIGAGVQGHSHLPVLGHLLEGCALAIFDRHPERAAGLAETAAGTPGIGAARVAVDARDAVAGADVVVTAASFGPLRQVMTPEWLAPDALVVAVDYATYCSAAVARGAGLFVVDERAQFLANRAAGLFDDYPDPQATIGEAILAGAARPRGTVLVTHLGVGLADVIFAAAILARAREQGLGVTLPR